MTDASNPTFEPFITVSLVPGVRAPYAAHGETKIAVVSNCPGVTSIHIHDGPAARKLAAELNRLADAIDPPPQAVRPFDFKAPLPIKPKRRSNKPKKAKRR